MTRLLASVNSLAEARLAHQAGADIIDLKEPAAGALGALPLATIAEICAWRPGNALISATIGDLPMSPETVASAVQTTAQAGVDFVKIGFFPGGDWLGVAARLADLPNFKARLIAVLFADAAPDLTFLDTLKHAGFAGVMLDTMDKNRGSLRRVMTCDAIAAFVSEAKRRQLLCGLAGSLRLEDIPELLRYEPDYLGFRGALCVGQKRTATLDYNAALHIKRIVSEEMAPLANA